MHRSPSRPRYGITIFVAAVSCGILAFGTATAHAVCNATTCNANDTACEDWGCVFDPDLSTTICDVVGVAPAGTPCGGSSTGCDAPDTCDGFGSCVDNVAVAGSVCRAATQPCDVTETCDGTSNTCPADAVQPDGTPCDDSNPATSNDMCQAGVCTGVTTSTTTTTTVAASTTTTLAGGNPPFGGDDSGFIPPPGSALLKCENRVAKGIAKLTAALVKCHVARASGKTTDDAAEDACESGAIAKFKDKTKTEGCGGCTNLDSIAATIEAGVDADNGLAYCQ